MNSTTTANRASALGVVGIGLALVLALVLMMLSSAVTRATPSGQGTLWLTDRNGAGTVSAYDASGTLLGMVWVGQNPIGVVGSPRTNRIYATNEGSGSNSISVIDADSITVLATIPTGPRPHHMQISPNGRYLYFGEFNTSKVGVLDTETHALREYPTAPSGNTTARTHSVWPTADGKYLYAANSDVANAASNGFIVKLDAADGTILWSLLVGNQPSEVTVAPNGRIGYVTVRGEGVVKVLDLETPAVIGTVSVGVQPDTLLLTPDGKLLTVTLRGSPAQMTIVDTRTLAATIVTLTGALAGHHDLSPDGRFTYVAVEGGPGLPPGIAVVDNQSATQVGFIQHPLPGARPHGLWLEARTR